MSNAFKDWIIANMPPTDDVDNIVFENAKLKEENERLQERLKNLPFNITKDIMDKVFNLVADKGGYLDRERPIISYDTLLDIVENVQKKYEKEKQNERD